MPAMTGGLRRQIFAVLAISIVAGALLAGAVSYHLFDRGLIGAFEARLQLQVTQVQRHLLAGMNAGLTVDQPQLLRRALSVVLDDEGLAAHDIVAITDPTGHILASTIGAEISDRLPPAWLEYQSAAEDRLALDDGQWLIYSEAVRSPFGTTEGYLVARLPISAAVPQRQAFLYRLGITVSAAGAVAIALVAALVWLVRWPTVRRVEALRDQLDELYREVGGELEEPSAEGPRRALPRPIAATFESYRATVRSLNRRLHREREELNRLDEAA